MRKIRISGQEPKCRALSLHSRAWQSRLALLALLLATPLAATPGGDLETMPAGDYVCELPGDATGPAGVHVPEEDFTVVTASSYRAGGMMGSYLEQSKTGLNQFSALQEQMQKQTEQMLSVFGMKPKA